jgi:hypothetical protein
VRVLKVRTGQGMIGLTPEEARALRDRLAQVDTARSAAETIAVSANASTSVTLTDTEKAAVFDVLVEWLESWSISGDSNGLTKLKDALAVDLGYQA